MPMPLISPQDVAALPEILSMDAAARLANRSMSWVRTHRNFGPLVPAELDGRQAVTRDSLIRMLNDMRPKTRGPALRLVVDNG